MKIFRSGLLLEVVWGCWQMKMAVPFAENGHLGCCWYRWLDHSGGFRALGVKFGGLDLFGEADLAEHPDAVVVDIKLVPGEAVARADRVGMVVVVPAFAAGEESDPPVIAGVVLGLEAALAPEVRRGVDEPGGVEADGDAEECSP